MVVNKIGTCSQTDKNHNIKLNIQLIFFNHATIYIKKRVTIGFLGDEKLDELFFFFILPFSEFLHLAYISCIY